MVFELFIQVSKTTVLLSKALILWVNQCLSAYLSIDQSRNISI